VGHAGEFCLDVRVYIEDTDAGGIVYYVNYLKYMERARTEWLRSLGFDKSVIFDQDIMFVVRDVSVSYRSSAVLDDRLATTVVLQDLRGAALEVGQTVCRGDEVLAEAAFTIACVSRRTRAPRRLPPPLAAALQGAFAGQNRDRESVDCRNSSA